MIDTQRLKEIIKNDAKIAFRYRNEDGETCIIGGMVEAAGLRWEDMGIPHEDLEGGGDLPIRMLPILESALCKAYDLTPGQLESLQETNDEYLDEDIDLRHESLMYLVNSWGN